MSSSGEIMENSHYDAEIWSEAVADTLDGFVSIEETAQRLGMSHDAAFHCATRFRCLSKRVKKPVQPDWEALRNSTIESLKGRKFSENASREPRNHGEKATRRGISNEQICIMTGVERNGGSAYAVTLNRARPSVPEIKTAFEGHIETGCVAFTDGLKGYRHLRKQLPA